MQQGLVLFPVDYTTFKKLIWTEPISSQGLLFHFTTVKGKCISALVFITFMGGGELMKHPGLQSR